MIWLYLSFGGGALVGFWLSALIQSGKKEPMETRNLFGRDEPLVCPFCGEQAIRGTKLPAFSPTNPRPHVTWCRCGWEVGAGSKFLMNKLLDKIYGE